MPVEGTWVKHFGHSGTGLASGTGAAVLLRAAVLRGVPAARGVEVRGVAVRAAALRTGVKWAVRSGVPPSRGRPSASKWR